MKKLLLICIFCLYSSISFCEDGHLKINKVYNEKGRLLSYYDVDGNLTIVFEKDARFLYNGCGYCDSHNIEYYREAYIYFTKQRICRHNNRKSIRNQYQCIEHINNLSRCSAFEQ